MGVLLAVAVSACAQDSSVLAVEPPPVREVVYLRHGDRELRAQVHRPASSEPAPGVLVLHGGSWTRGGPWRMDHVARQLARSGYVAVNVEYRLAPEFIFPAQLHDAKAAVRWMRSNADRFGIDPERIGAFGYSAGGHLAALLATTSPADGLGGDVPAGTPSSRIQAAVLGGAPTDLRDFVPNPIIGRFLGGSPDEIPETYTAASPIVYVSADDPPVFLYHGRLDWVVDPSQSVRFGAALEAVGVPNEHFTAPMGHVGTAIFDDDEVAAAIRFLDRWLRQPPAQS